MDIASYEASPYVDPLMQDLERYDLMKHALELEAYGLTVIPRGEDGHHQGLSETSQRGPS